MASNTDQKEQDIHLAAAVLSKRYEEQLFKQGSAYSRVVPALVITGFLGAGKTTLLQHLLSSCGSELKLGVLVNEVAHLDVDSQLLNASSSNAAAGIKAVQLSGGCACCAVSSDLTKALADLVGSSSYQQLDHLLLETSGVADAAPLAASLSAAGFRLTGVVAVVDVEAGLELLQQEIAQAQLRAADIVVLNKCDLASLGTVSSVEDKVQEVAPGVKMLRARFGQVPAEALLDVEVPEYEAAKEEVETNSGVALGRAQGEIAFLSHEPIVSIINIKAKQRQGVGSLRHTAASTTNPNPSNGLAQHSAAHHNSFGSVTFMSSEPLCMACFQSFVANQLVAATGLFRAKGFLWFQQLRDQQYVFHLSGKQRVECGSKGRWEEPPAVQLVLIGQQQESLLQLKAGLQECIAQCCACSSSEGLHLHPATDCTAQAGTGAAAGGAAKQPQTEHRNRAAAQLVKLISQHQWLEVCHPSLRNQLQKQESDKQGQQLAQPNSSGDGLVEFTAKASVLHGVLAEEVNARLLRRANSASGVFLCHVKSPAVLQMPALQHARYQGVATLQLCCRAMQSTEDAVQWWEQFHLAVAPTLKSAYQHVHNCKCDVPVVQ